MTIRIAVTSLALTSFLLPAATTNSQSRARDAANRRLQASAQVIEELLRAPDRGVPAWVLQRAHCVAVIPHSKKAGFIFGGQYGKGEVTCRAAGGGWTAPSMVRVEGGSFGLQIGAGEVDAVVFIMNEAGKEKLITSRFTLGAEAGAMAGPFGRTTKAETDAFLHAGMLCYSRSRGLFAGAMFEGATLRPDNGDNLAIYGTDISHRQILHGGVGATAAARPLLQQLGRRSPYERNARRPQPQQRPVSARTNGAAAGGTANR